MKSALVHAFGGLLALMASAATLGVNASPASVETRPCRAEGARYELLADPRYWIMLVAAPEPGTASDLQLHLSTPLASHDFSFTVSNGYGVMRLLPVATTSLHDGMDDEGTNAMPPAFHAFDKDMTALNDPPQADASPPAWLFVPELGPLLWYGGLPHADGSMVEREAMPTGMFRLVDCTH